jgi:hypothetical protein
MSKYIKYKEVYKITLYGRNDANRLANGNSSRPSIRNERTATETTRYITNIISQYTNSKIYRFNLNHSFKNIAKGSKVILIYARIPGFLGSSNHRTIRLCGAEGTNCFDTERGLGDNPILCVIGEGGATDVNYFNTDPTLSGVEVPENFLSKGFIEVEISTIAKDGDIGFPQAEVDDLCLSFIIYEPDEELTKDINLAPEVNLASLAYKQRPPKINY